MESIKEGVTMSTQSQSSAKLSDEELDQILSRSSESIPSHGDMLSSFHAKVRRSLPFDAWKIGAYGVSFACLAAVAFMVIHSQRATVPGINQVAAVIPMGGSVGSGTDQPQVVIPGPPIQSRSLDSGTVRHGHNPQSHRVRSLAKMLPKRELIAMRSKNAEALSANGVLNSNSLFDVESATIKPQSNKQKAFALDSAEIVASLGLKENNRHLLSETALKSQMSKVTKFGEVKEARGDSVRYSDESDSIEIVDEERGFVSQGRVSSARGESTDEVSINIVSEADQTEKRDLP